MASRKIVLKFIFTHIVLVTAKNMHFAQSKPVRSLSLIQSALVGLLATLAISVKVKIIDFI